MVTDLVTSREETEKRNLELSAKLEEAERKIAAQENEINSNKARLEEQDTVIQGFTHEITELNGIITNKNQELMKYKKLEDEIASLKAESLLKELRNKNQNDSADLRTKFEQSDRTDQILKLKNQLEDAYDTISRLEKEKAAINATVTKLSGNGSLERKKHATRDFEMQVNFDTDGGPFSIVLHIRRIRTRRSSLRPSLGSFLGPWQTGCISSRRFSWDLATRV